jgi:hypothetical protein
MGPAQRKPLLLTLLVLSEMQLDALEDATYLGWTEESLEAYEERWNLILEIRSQLD